MIRMIPRKKRHALREVTELGDGAGQIYATDFYVDGAEAWDPVPGGLAHPDGRVVNVDHHAPLPRMERQVTSTLLALERIGAGLAPERERDCVVITHMDCDSVLAAGILSGRLEPDAAWGEASLAADHTGEENAVADLLQALDADWSRRGRPMPDPKGLELFYETLLRHVAGKPLGVEAEEALTRRCAGREHARRLVEAGRFEAEAGVHFATLSEPLEGELLLPHLSEAAIVATVNPHRLHPERWQLKLRLGRAAPAGLSLHDLHVGEFDEGYGGRWNAGSNNRGEGTTRAPGEIRRWLVGAMRRWEERAPNRPTAP
jgi:hypothetical protein